MIDVIHEINAVRRQVGRRVLEAGEAHTVTISRSYAATVDDVWDACTNPERIPRWFLPVSGDLRVKDAAIGRLTLRDYYPQLTQAERDEREEFAVEACYLMRDRFLSEEVWETVGLPVEECVGYVESSQFMRQFRSLLFSRIVPTIKDIGLWGPKIRKGYEQMGILGFAETDVQAMAEEDERVAEEYDTRRDEIARVAASASGEPAGAGTVNGGTRPVSL